MIELLVEHSLGFAQLQDGGRFGVRHLGITQGGALDWVAMQQANWLLGNTADATVIEIPLGGLQLRAHASGWLALTGADLDAKLDDQPLAPGQAFQLRHGQTLQFNNPKRGVRAYLATPGGFAAEPVMDAVATVMREQLGGLHGNGRGLHNSDRLQGKAGDAEPRTLPADALWYPGNEVVLDLIPGEQIAAFTGASLFAAFNQSWTLDQRADRMGMRLTGPALRYQGQALISEGIPLGAVQVPPDGQPIILMNDRQTIGGYPRLGAVTPLSLARLAQCAPGQKVRLRVVSQESARREMLNVISTLQAQGALPGLAHP